MLQLKIWVIAHCLDIIYIHFFNGFGRSDEQADEGSQSDIL